MVSTAEGVAMNLHPIALIAVLAACGAATTNEPPSIARTTFAVGVDPSSHGHLVPEPVATFADDQVLGLVATINTEAIDLASIAMRHATDERLMSLATLLAADHTEARDREARLSERLAMPLAPTKRMQAMRQEATTEVAHLETLTGTAFDVTYLEHAASAERDALSMLDLQLIPSARIPEILAHLADLRERADRNLRDVEDLQLSFAEANASARR
jgi:putative membrane protein